MAAAARAQGPEGPWRTQSPLTRSTPWCCPDDGRGRRTTHPDRLIALYEKICAAVRCICEAATAAAAVLRFSGPSSEASLKAHANYT